VRRSPRGPFTRVLVLCVHACCVRGCLFLTARSRADSLGSDEDQCSPREEVWLYVRVLPRAGPDKWARGDAPWGQHGFRYEGCRPGHHLRGPLVEEERSEEARCVCAPCVRPVIVRRPRGADTRGESLGSSRVARWTGARQLTCPSFPLSWLLS